MVHFKVIVLVSFEELKYRQACSPLIQLVFGFASE